MKQDPRLAVNLGFGQLLSNEAYFNYWRACAAMGPLFLMASNGFHHLLGSAGV